MTNSANTTTVVLDSAGFPDAIIDAAGVALVVVDPAGEIVRWNRAATALTGFSALEMLGQNFATAVICENEVERWNGEFSLILAGTARVAAAYRWKMRDGSARVLSGSSAIIRNGTGEIAYVVCTITGETTAALSMDIMCGRIRERRDISSFLHRTISQNLVALSFSVSKLHADVEGDALAATANGALDLLDRCCRDVRVISYMLAPPVPFETDFDALVASYVDYLRDEVGLTIALETVSAPGNMSPEVQSLFFATVQEWTSRAIRKNPVAHLEIRFDTEADASGRRQIVLELESTPGGPAILDSWVLFRECAGALGGEFRISGCPLKAFARLSLSEGGLCD
jgi:PAS domain S-box-containing protein